jgi:hypothetical protein
MVPAESTSKCCLNEDSQPLILAHIEDEIRLKNWLRRQWQITRFKASVTKPSDAVKQAQQAKGRIIEENNKYHPDHKYNFMFEFPCIISLYHIKN